MTDKIEGVYCAAATPIDADGNPDSSRFVSHCRALLDEGCHGIAPLGTTGEANNFSIDQRRSLLDAVVEGGVAAHCLLPGTSMPSIGDAIVLTRHAVRHGVKACLMLPPYYYKGVSDDGLFRFYAGVIDGVGEARLRVVLYHIPQLSQVPISHDLIERLMSAYPGIVCAIKDSAGKLDNMLAMRERFPGLSVLAGADPLMLPLLRAGGAGCITAVSNLRADALRVVWDNWRDPAREAEVDAAQQRLETWRNLANRYVQIASIKAMLARRRGNQGWMKPLPPLVELDDDARDDIWAEMGRLGE